MNLFFRVIFLFSLFPAVSLYGQSARAFLKAGGDAAKQGDWAAAFSYFQEAHFLQPKNPEIILQCGEAAFKYVALEAAEAYLSLIAQSDEWFQKYPQTGYLLGDVYRGMGNYEEAISWYQRFREENCSPDSLCRVAQQKENGCLWVLEQKPDSSFPNPITPGKRINSPYSDFAPFPVGDSLFFSSYRYPLKNDSEKPERLITKTVLSKSNRTPRPLPRMVNSSSEHTANFIQSRDGKWQIFSRCHFKGKVAIECALYYRQRSGTNRWSKPKPLPEEINKAGSSNTQPAIGFDPVRNRTVLFFVSNRTGGMGGFDIWMTWLNDENEWEAPQNLTLVNTPGNEVTPFFDEENNLLYFSSDAYFHQNRGGLDVFQLDRKSQLDGQPLITALPSPVNSSYNDFYFIRNIDSTALFFVSNRPGSQYLDPENKTCCNDIYKIIFPTESPVLIPQDSCPCTEPVPAPPDSITFQEKVYDDLEDFLPLSLYFHNDEPDAKSRKSSTKKPYLETLQGFISLREKYISEFTSGMEADQAAIAADTLEHFFENQVDKGGKLLVRFSDILLARLQEGEQVEVFLKGFTSPRAQAAYNLLLSKRRISSVRNHFAEYQDGIFKPFLTSGKLIISEVPFGETKAAASVSDAYEDLKNSVYGVPASRERRVEIVEILRD